MPNTHYTVKDRRTIAQTDTLRVVRTVLAEGESIPWHFHTLITDTTFCLAGSVTVEMEDPYEKATLKPGEHVVVNARRRHRVSGEGERVVLLVQGVGKYDFIPVIGQ